MKCVVLLGFSTTGKSSVLEKQKGTFYFFEQRKTGEAKGDILLFRTEKNRATGRKKNGQPLNPPIAITITRRPMLQMK